MSFFDIANWQVVDWLRHLLLRKLTIKASKSETLVSPFERADDGSLLLTNVRTWRITCVCVEKASDMMPANCGVLGSYYKCHRKVAAATADGEGWRTAPRQTVSVSQTKSNPPVVQGLATRSGCLAGHDLAFDTGVPCAGCRIHFSHPSP